MEYNFNNPFGYPWNTSNPYLLQQNPGNIQQFNGNLPNPTSFNNPLLFNGPRYPGNGMPFGVNGPFGNQNGNPSVPNPQFGNNWNFNYQPGMNSYNPVPPNQGNTNNTNCGVQGSSIKAEEKDKQTDEFTDKIVEKVSSMLLEQNILNNPTKAPVNSVHLSSTNATSELPIETTDFESDSSEDNTLCPDQNCTVESTHKENGMT